MKRIIGLILAVCLFFSLAVIPAAADEVDEPARIYASDLSCYAGDSVWIYIYAENLDNVAAIDFCLLYDNSVFTVTSAELYGLMSGTLSDVNVTDQSVNFSVVSMTAINGSGSIARLRISVNSSLEAGEYLSTLAVGDVYDAGLQPLSVSGSSFKLNVSERPVITPTQTIYPYAVSLSRLYTEDDEFTLVFYSSYVNNLGALDLISEYDSTLLSLTNAVLGSALTSSQQALWSMNTDI